MIVLVDTTVWSLALRRRPDALGPDEVRIVDEWTRLVHSGGAALAGPIRQEVLSGIRRREAFVRIQERLGDFHHFRVASSDYDQAAMFFNACRARGVSATPIDMLLCAVAHRRDVPIFTTDGDFTHYARCVGVRLHGPR